ncbi:MAG: hypothetical protein H6737_02445 [Alphaproteobacteria bacterium]|nr:hypothetical protein [Alphaproteobacteria bacterium]
MRTPLATALAVSALLLPACHGRFRHAVENLGEVRLVPETRTGPDVDLARIYSADPGIAGVMAESYNLSQMMREGRLSAIIAEKIDADQMNAAFVYGIREQLDGGPPFSATDAGQARIDLRVVDWGLEVTGYPFPAVFTYKIRARGTLPDGTPFYRATFKCTGDAGEARWIDAYGWGSRDEQRLEALPAEVVQETFDKAAYACGHQFAEKLRQHAGL